MYTQDDLNNLQKAYARGVLKVREGNDWVEYHSMAQMRQAIVDIKAELAAQSTGNEIPSGARVTVVKRPYYG